MLDGLFDPLRWSSAIAQSDILWQGFFFTLRVAAAGLSLALALGCVLGVFSTLRSRVLRALSRVYIELYQNTPLVVQVFFMYNAGPQLLQAIMKTPLPVRIPPFVLGYLAVGLYHAAYVAEVVRTGIESVPSGQTESAHSQGFSRLQSYIYIVLPQTIRVVLPPLCNQALNLIKNSSVLALVAGGDLMYNADNMVSGTGYLQGYLLCCAMYFLLCFPLALLVHYLEHRYRRRPKAKKVLSATTPTAEV